MVLAKIALLQGAWFLIVLKSVYFRPLLTLIFCLFILSLNYVLFKPRVSKKKYVLFSLLFTCAGAVLDGGLIAFDIVKSSSYSLTYLGLWPIFVCYYDDIFKKFLNVKSVYLGLLGGAGGAMAYWSCLQLNALSSSNELVLLGATFAYWFIFFPGSLHMYHETSLWGKFLDKTILFSFDKTGFNRHKNHFEEAFDDINLEGKQALVTGGTSGIGAEVGLSLAQQGASVTVTGRSKDKGRRFADKHQKLKFISLDMADWNAIEELCENTPPLDLIALNAGGMPKEVTFNDEGVEFQCASQLVGHYLLIEALRRKGKLGKGARVVWVSSGGMYLKKLDLDKLFSGKDYDKVDTYANVKRAQVTLVEELAKSSEWKAFTMVSMHPGWVDTGGLEEALPRFYKLIGNRLRSASQGADTVSWLLATKTDLVDGKFYFDRNTVSPYISDSYKPSKKQREQLVDSLKSYVDSKLN